VFNKHDTVEQVVSTNPLNLSFRRTLGGVKLTEYINLVAYLRDFNLADRRALFLGNYIIMDNFQSVLCTKN